VRNGNKRENGRRLKKLQYSVRDRSFISESKTAHDLRELCNWLVPPDESGRQHLCFGNYLMTD